MSEESRIETMLRNILGETDELPVPVSRIEKMLANMCGGAYEIDEPVSRIEHYLYQILENGGSGGGGGGGDEFLIGMVENTLTAITAEDLKIFSKIGDYGLSSKTYVESIEVPSNIESIGNYGFANAFFCKEVTIHHGVKSIGSYAFQRCGDSVAGLQASLDIPDSVESIGIACFSGSKIKTITLGRGIKTIGSNAMYGVCTINCKFSEGAVAGAPWGATSATITYDFDGD